MSVVISGADGQQELPSPGRVVARVAFLSLLAVPLPATAVWIALAFSLATPSDGLLIALAAVLACTGLVTIAVVGRRWELPPWLTGVAMVAALLAAAVWFFVLLFAVIVIGCSAFDEMCLD